jgi:hypothetical protein
MNTSYESDIQFPVFDLNHLITNFPLPTEEFSINCAQNQNSSRIPGKGQQHAMVFFKNNYSYEFFPQIWEGFYR